MHALLQCDVILASRLVAGSGEITPRHTVVVQFAIKPAGRMVSCAQAEKLSSHLTGCISVANNNQAIECNLDAPTYNRRQSCKQQQLTRHVRLGDNSGGCAQVASQDTRTAIRIATYATIRTQRLMRSTFLLSHSAQQHCRVIRNVWYVSRMLLSSMCYMCSPDNENVRTAAVPQQQCTALHHRAAAGASGALEPGRILNAAPAQLASHFTLHPKTLSTAPA